MTVRRDSRLRVGLVPHAELVTRPTATTVQTWKQIVSIWHEHGLAIAVLGTQLLVAAVAGMLGTESQRERGLFAGEYVWLLVRVAAAWLIALFAIEFALARSRGGVTWSDFRRQFSRLYLSTSVIAGVALGIALIAQAAVVHDAWKSTLGVIAPYTWDERLHVVDVAIHRGVEPWRHLEWLLASPSAVRAVDLAYAAWYPLMMVVGCWFLWTPRRRLRQRFLVAWMLKWALLGAVAAHMLASAGPAFFDLVADGADPYADLMSRLRSIDLVYNLNAIFIQNAIRANVLSGGDHPWLYMSAMPSLHVAVPALFALALARVNRWFSAGLWAYTVVIMTGSVLLGWHYAIDGYVSLIGIVAIWRLSGWLVRRSRVPVRAVAA